MRKGSGLPLRSVSFLPVDLARFPGVRARPEGVLKTLFTDLGVASFEREAVRVFRGVDCWKESSCLFNKKNNLENRKPREVKEKHRDRSGRESAPVQFTKARSDDIRT